MSYLLLKWLHMVGASALLGTGFGIAFFAWFGVRMARHTGDLGLMRGVLRLTVIADFAFTAPAVVLQLGSGLAMWSIAGLPWSHRWLWLVLALYAGIGALWLPVVALQLRMRDLALRADGMATLPAEFERLLRAWFWLGIPAFAGVLLMLGLMVWRGVGW
jgi:uncharacterized membrane protein